MNGLEGYGNRRISAFIDHRSLFLKPGMDIWLAYTQLSFWQLYNSAFLAPVRDTNYEPELLINFRTNCDLFGFKGRFFNVGFNHRSNGRSRPLSRSWNRIVGNVGVERGHFGLQLRTWYRLPDGESLLDYNKSVNRISAGFMVAEWN